MGLLMLNDEPYSGGFGGGGGSSVLYGYDVPSGSAEDGSLYILLNERDKELGKYLYIQSQWKLISGQGFEITQVHSASQRNYATGATTYTATKSGFVLCINQNMNGEASTKNLTATFNTQATLVSEDLKSDSYSSPNRNNSTRIAIYRVSVGDTITFENSIDGGGYTTQLHVAYLVENGYIITRNDFLAQQDATAGTSKSKTISNANFYLAIGFEHSGAGTANNTAFITTTGAEEQKIFEVFETALIGCSVGFIEMTSGTITFSWANNGNYVTRGYVLYELS